MLHNCNHSNSVHLLKRTRTGESNVAIDNPYEEIACDFFDIILNSSYITLGNFTVSKIIDCSIKLLILDNIEMRTKEKAAVAIAKIVKAIPK